MRVVVVVVVGARTQKTISVHNRVPRKHVLRW